MKKIEFAYEILSESRRSTALYAETRRDFHKVKAHMYSIFECYAHGLLSWAQVRDKWHKSILEYLNLYNDDKKLYLEESSRMLGVYESTLSRFKPALDEYKKVYEERMVSNIVVKNKLNESQATEQSKIYFNRRALSETALKDIAAISKWADVVENYPNLITKDEQRLRMLTIFEAPSGAPTTSIKPVPRPGRSLPGGGYQNPNGSIEEPPGYGRPQGPYDNDNWFNPRAGQMDQPDFPQNQGLAKPKSTAPFTSPRPRPRPLQAMQSESAKPGTVVKEAKLADIIPQLEKELNSGAGFDRRVFQLDKAQRSRAPGPWGFGSAGGGIIIRWMTYGAKSLAEERGVDVNEVIREAQQYMKKWLQQNTKPITVRDRDSGETKQFYIKGSLAFAPASNHVRINTKSMLKNPSRFEIKEGEKHGAKTGSQVKGSEPVPAKRKPTKGGETPHPMRGRLVGEETVNEISDEKKRDYLKKATSSRTFFNRPTSLTHMHLNRSDAKVKKDDPFYNRNPESDKIYRDAEAYWDRKYNKRKAMVKKARGSLGEGNDQFPDEKTDLKAFIKEQRKEGWSVYVSRTSFRATNDIVLEFEKDDQEFEIIGQGNRWELFFGPNLSGRGKEFDSVEAAFAAATNNTEKQLESQANDFYTSIKCKIGKK